MPVARESARVVDASIIHFGVDVCGRVPVLQSAGFQVNVCPSIDPLIHVLQQNATDAVAVPAMYVSRTGGVLREIRSRLSIPWILFEEGHWQPHEANFDLVIPPLTSPEEWLSEIAKLLITRSKHLRVEARQLYAQASILRNESGVVRQQSIERRERSRQLSKNFARLDNSDPTKTQ